MTLSPKILAALKKVDEAHAALFAALEEEARRKRPSRRRGAPSQRINRGAMATPHADSPNGEPTSKVL